MAGTAASRLTDVMARRPWVRYAGAAVFMGIVAVRIGFVLASYPPKTAASWASLIAGALIGVVVTSAAVWRSKPTMQLKDHPLYSALLVLAILVIAFGLIAGLGLTPAGHVNVGSENASVRAFGVGASLGAVTLFGLGSHRAAHKARSRLAGASSD
jgi:hypothetical protein